MHTRCIASHASFTGLLQIDDGSPTAGSRQGIVWSEGPDQNTTVAAAVGCSVLWRFGFVSERKWLTLLPEALDDVSACLMKCSELLGGYGTVNCGFSRMMEGLDVLSTQFNDDLDAHSFHPGSRSCMLRHPSKSEREGTREDCPRVPWREWRPLAPAARQRSLPFNGCLCPRAASVLPVGRRIPTNTNYSSRHCDRP